jgi:hypothetical protein
MCKIHRLMAAVIPFARMREVFILRQIERCPRCGEGENLDDPRVAQFLNPGWVRETADLWPLLRDRLLSGEPSGQDAGRVRGPARSFIRKWAWAAAVAGLAALCLLVLIGLRHSEKVPPQAFAPLPAMPPQVEPRVLVLDAELQGRPAKPYVYQTATGSFIWITPSKKNGD